MVNFVTDLRHPYNKAGDGPEGPEVTVMGIYLDRLISGKTIESIEYIGKDKFVPNIGPNVSPKVKSSVRRVFNRGKLIVLELNDDIFITSHLGMSGYWYHVYNDDKDFKKSDHVVITFDNLFLIYNDVRTIGSSFNIYTVEEFEKKINTLGPDPIYTTFLKHIKLNNKYIEGLTYDYFAKAVKNGRRKNSYIGIFLMNQRYIAGIGNYIRAEVLYRAKISPYRQLKDLTDEDIQLLYDTIIEYMYTAFCRSGTYRFDHINIKLKIPLEDDVPVIQIYRQRKDRYGNRVVSEGMKGRTIHYVPDVQK